MKAPAVRISLICVSTLVVAASAQPASSRELQQRFQGPFRPRDEEAARQWEAQGLGNGNRFAPENFPLNSAMVPNTGAEAGFNGPSMNGNGLNGLGSEQLQAGAAATGWRDGNGLTPEQLQATDAAAGANGAASTETTAPSVPAKDSATSSAATAGQPTIMVILPDFLAPSGSGSTIVEVGTTEKPAVDDQADEGSKPASAAASTRVGLANAATALATIVVLSFAALA